MLRRIPGGSKDSHVEWPQSHVPSSLVVLALLSAALFNLIYWTYAMGAELRVGFYLWILSFACLAAGAHVFRGKQVTGAAA